MWSNVDGGSIGLNKNYIPFIVFNIIQIQNQIEVSNDIIEKFFNVTWPRAIHTFVENIHTHTHRCSNKPTVTLFLKNDTSNVLNSTHMFGNFFVQHIKDRQFKFKWTESKLPVSKNKLPNQMMHNWIKIVDFQIKPRTYYTTVVRIL